jgi:hypothetical protein
MARQQMVNTGEVAEMVKEYRKMSSQPRPWLSCISGQKILKFLPRLPNVSGKEEAMGWIMFFLGMMVGMTIKKPQKKRFNSASIFS